MNRLYINFIKNFLFIVISTIYPVSSLASLYSNRMVEFEKYCNNTITKTDIFDKIVAIVNTDTITFYDLYQEIQKFHHKEINIDLIKNCLNNLINNLLIHQQSNLLNISVDENEIIEFIQEIANHNNIDFNLLKFKVINNGIKWIDYINDIKYILLKKKLQNFMAQHVIISDCDIITFLEEYRILENMRKDKISQDPSKIFYNLSEFLVKIPQKSSKNEINIIYKKTQNILDQLKNGSEINDIMNNISYNQNQIYQYSSLGVKALKNWPNLFAENIKNLNTNDYSEIITSNKGFHIIKISDRFINYNICNKEDYNYFLGYSDIHGNPFILDVDLSSLKNIKIQYIQKISNEYLSNKKILNDLLEYKKTALSNEIKLGKVYLKPKYDLNYQIYTCWINEKQLFNDFKIDINNIKYGDMSDILKIGNSNFYLIQFNEYCINEDLLEIIKTKVYSFLLEQRVNIIFTNWIENIKGNSYIDIRL
ncbi:Chaperone SurA [Candidatus Kinetoplastibacterium sorsogonicusi]|uniref:Chaperone SurA n=1 Tax=Candidatus Kinetoplastidibacterium kentomonadis TaxID=1576550 RepID=A0A3S7J9A8_9PROT|nr:peptidylprolyl isomerase [Candidatus Kinetoplastibacterium sorsogonicusi]AWD32249.1 Chaperone SurA [Candidatus Kinetoplastibacterium sorsogonicusi]